MNSHVNFQPSRPWVAFPAPFLFADIWSFSTVNQLMSIQMPFSDETFSACFTNMRSFSGLKINIFLHEYEYESSSSLFLWTLFGIVRKDNREFWDHSWLVWSSHNLNKLGPRVTYLNLFELALILWVSQAGLLFFKRFLNYGQESKSDKHGYFECPHLFSICHLNFNCWLILYN